MKCDKIVCLFVLGACIFVASQDLEKLEYEASVLWAEVDKRIDELYHDYQEADWTYNTNVTDYNRALRDQVYEVYSNYSMEKALEFEQKYAYKEFKNESLRDDIQNLIDSSVPNDAAVPLNNVADSMLANYYATTVCEYRNCSNCEISLSGFLQNIFQASSDPDELLHYWTSFFNTCEPKNHDLFKKYAELTKEYATTYGYNSYDEIIFNSYNVSNFEQQVDAVIEKVRPFFLQFHAYVRFQLRKIYGDDRVSATGPIPMHFTGDLWAFRWNKVNLSRTAPFPGKQNPDVTPEMLSQGYTVDQMYRMADKYYQDMGLLPLPPSFYTDSLLEKPSDGRTVNCNGNAWDFLHGEVRVKFCTEVKMDHFLTVHHELGHTQNFMQYKDLPRRFRDAANPGFQEGIGDTISLSVSSPTHLKKIGLLKGDIDEGSQINAMFTGALFKLVLLFSTVAVDKYRWGIYRGETSPEEYGCKYYESLLNYIGVEPPVFRDSSLWDASCQLHVADNVNYIQYFVAFIYQYQFLKGLCIKAGQYDPNDPYSLLNCDFGQSTEAGKAFGEMMALGSSKPWPDALELITGQREIDASAFVEYFAPLQQFLEKFNRENCVPVGWTGSDKFKCPSKECRPPQ